MNELVVGSVMTGPVTTCNRSMPLQEVVQSVAQAGLSCVVVVEDAKPVGIVTERDLVKVLDRVLEGEQNLKQVSVEEVMTGSPVCVREMTTLFEALVITQTQGFRHLPVVDQKGYIVGILTYSDLARAYEGVISQQRKALEEAVGNKTRYLKEINEQLKTLSLEDSLLKIGNRRAMEIDVSYTHKAANAQNGDYALILFDVDAFKEYNDNYGHQAGDQALKDVSKIILSCIRTNDRLYRYGGEELLLLMPGANLKNAENTATRTLQKLEDENIRHCAGPYTVLTMSAGVSSYQTSLSSNWEEVLELADQALYTAKKSGRNRVSIAREVTA